MNQTSIASQYQFFKPKDVSKIILYDYRRSTSKDPNIQELNALLNAQGLDHIKIFEPEHKNLYQCIEKEIKEGLTRGWVIVIHSSAFRNQKSFPFNLFSFGSDKNTPEKLREKYKEKNVIFVRRSQVKGQTGDIEEVHRKYYKISKVSGSLKSLFKQLKII